MPRRLHRGRSLSWASVLVFALGCQITPVSQASDDDRTRVHAALGAMGNVGIAPPKTERRNEQKPGNAIEPQKARTEERASSVQPSAAKTAPKNVMDGCPENMASVGAACVDRYEAHLVVGKKGAKLVPHPAYERPPTGTYFEARSGAGVLPQSYISRHEASLACENAGKRLCSLDEWYSACRGPDDTTFPYGEDYEKGRCNVARPHILSELFGKDSSAWTYEHFNDPRLIQKGYLAPSGDHERCSNEFGVYDMVGNLHEWVSDRADRSLATKLPLTPGIRRALGRNTGNGVFMGGFFSTVHQHGRGCEFVTTFHEPRYHDYSTGFRCCQDR